MTSTCPSCGASQPQALLCWQCSEDLLTLFKAVPALLDELQTAIAKQAKVGASGGKGGLARERSPLNFGALAVRDALLVELALWDTGDIDAIRKHPKAADIVRGVGRAVKDAYRAIDRMQDRQYLGQCMADIEGQTCYAEIWARPGANQVTCPACRGVHDVFARRAWLLEEAADMLFKVPEAARLMGEVGGIHVTQARIRGYIHRGRIAYKTGTMIRLGDLLTVVLDDSERKGAA